MSDPRSCPYYYSNAPPGSGSVPSQFVLYRPFIEVILLAIVQFFFFLLLVLFDALSQQPIALFTEITLLLIALLGIVIYFLRDEELWIYYVLAVAFGLAIDIAFLFFVLMHALTGAYMVLTDVERFDRSRRALAGIAVIAGVLLFVYGTQTILAF